jgi:hypothetical protein
MSCPSAGNCVADGWYTSSSTGEQAFVANKVHGTWLDAIEVPGTSVLGVFSAQVNSVSCASAGNCAVGGTYTDSSYRGQAFVADQVNGTWQTAVEVPGTPTLNKDAMPNEADAFVQSVSCPSPGNCAAGGSYAGSLADRDRGARHRRLEHHRRRHGQLSVLPVSGELRGRRHLRRLGRPRGVHQKSPTAATALTRPVAAPAATADGGTSSVRIT